MKRIPNWRHWPKQVFTFPTTIVIGCGSYFLVRDEIAGWSTATSVLVFSGALFWCCVAGFSVEIGLRRARRWRRPVTGKVRIIEDEAATVLGKTTGGGKSAALHALLADAVKHRDVTWWAGESESEELISANPLRRGAK